MSRRAGGRRGRVGPDGVEPPGRASAHVLDALLAGDRLARPLAGPGVGPGPLAADRQALAVPQAPVAADVAEPGDVLLHLPAELTLDHVLVVQQVRQPGQLVLVQVASPLLGVDGRLLAELL